MQSEVTFLDKAAQRRCLEKTLFIFREPYSHLDDIRELRGATALPELL